MGDRQGQDWNRHNITTLLDVLALLLVAVGLGWDISMLITHRSIAIGTGMLVSGVVVGLVVWLWSREPGQKERE